LPSTRRSSSASESSARGLFQLFDGQIDLPGHQMIQAENEMR
jgi:hypothetical protein